MKATKSKIKNRKEKHLGTMAMKDQAGRVKLLQLKKKYRYHTGGSGRRFLLGLARRQLMRAYHHKKREACKKMMNGGWMITSQAPDSLPDIHYKMKYHVEKDAPVATLNNSFSVNEEDSSLMSLPVQKVVTNIEDIPLAGLVYSLLIDNYIDQASCVALALSGARGFSSQYSSSRKRKGLVINEQCFYLTSASFNTLINQNISLQCITLLNLNNLYWLPAELLESTILKMTKLQDLSIKGTEVSTVRQVAKILQSCRRIKSLDFTFTEGTLEDIENGLKQEKMSFKTLRNGFKKLTSLKISTTAVPDPEYRPSNNRKDPWILIIKILSCCRDCTDLKIEVTYPSQHLDYLRELRSDGGGNYYQHVGRDWHRSLDWMKSLKSLVLIKLGPSDDSGNGDVEAPLLDKLLCTFLFPRIANPIVPSRPLQRLWIENFLVSRWHRFDPLKYVSVECLTSFKNAEDGFEDDFDEGDSDLEDPDNEFFGEDHLPGETSVEPFHNLEHFGSQERTIYSPFSSMLKLKYATGTSQNDGQFYKFCRTHPELEHLSVDFKRDSSIAYVPNDDLCKLPKLKSISCRRTIISEDFIHSMTEAYPHLEVLELSDLGPQLSQDWFSNASVLSALSFSKLKSLTLRGFQLGDGAFLLKIAEKCPKIEVLHMETDLPTKPMAQFNINTGFFR